MRRFLPLLAFLICAPLHAATETIAALNTSVSAGTEGRGSAGFQLVGSCSAGVVTFQGTIDDTNWASLQVFPIGSSTGVTSASAAGIWSANVGGLLKVRAIVTDACDSDNFVASIRITEATAGSSGGGGSGTQYAEDSAHVSGDTVTMAGFVQQTANTALSTDGDRSLGQVDESGFLKVSVENGAGFDCTGHAIYSNTTNGNTELVALSGSTVIYVCQYLITTSQTTAVSVRLVRGTGSACATNETSMTPTFVLQAPASTGPVGVNPSIGGHTGHKTAAGDALCIETNQAVAVQAEVWYAQF